MWIRPCDSVVGDALDAMRAALPLEHGVRAVALDRERDFLEAALLVRARRQLLELEAAALGVAREHAVDVARPERRLVAADALADLDDHVLAVGRVGLDERELELLLEPLEPFLELGQQLAQVGVGTRGLGVVASLAPLLRELVRRLELLQPPADLGRLAVVVEDGRVGHPLLRLAVGAVDLVDEILDSGHDSRNRTEPGLTSPAERRG